MLSHTIHSSPVQVTSGPVETEVEDFTDLVEAAPTIDTAAAERAAAAERKALEERAAAERKVLEISV